MKSSKIIILILAIFSLNKLSGQSDAIVGVWLTEEEDSKIEIFKHGN